MNSIRWSIAAVLCICMASCAAPNSGLADQLRAAIKADDADRMCQLIKLGAPVDTDVEFEIIVEKNIWKINGKPLHWAAAHSNNNTVELLLAHGADVKVKDEDGMTALHWAAWYGYKDTAELLLGHRADVEAKDNHGQTALHVAVNFRNTYTAALLLAHGANVMAKDEFGMTPLHLAAWIIHKDTATAKLLLSLGADPYLKNNEGQSPIDHWPSLADIVKEVEAKKAAAEPLLPKK
jgi:ankyrin repeat protein